MLLLGAKYFCQIYISNYLINGYLLVRGMVFLERSKMIQKVFPSLSCSTVKAKITCCLIMYSVKNFNNYTHQRVSKRRLTKPHLGENFCNLRTDFQRNKLQL